jgi:hypothetical protein
MVDEVERKAETIRADASGQCPFCGRAVSVRWGLHAQPTCEAFDRMSGDDFVRAVVNGKQAT